MKTKTYDSEDYTPDLSKYQIHTGVDWNILHGQIRISRIDGQDMTQENKIEVEAIFMVLGKNSRDIAEMLKQKDSETFSESDKIMIQAEEKADRFLNDFYKSNQENKQS